MEGESLQFDATVLCVTATWSFGRKKKTNPKIWATQESEKERQRNDGWNLLWTRRFFFFLSATTAAAAFSSFTIFSHSRMVRYWLLFFLAIYTQEDTDTRTAKNARTAVPIEEKWKKVGCKSVRPSVGRRDSISLAAHLLRFNRNSSNSSKRTRWGLDHQTI